MLRASLNVSCHLQDKKGKGRAEEAPGAPDAQGERALELLLELLGGTLCRRSSSHLEQVRPPALDTGSASDCSTRDTLSTFVGYRWLCLFLTWLCTHLNQKTPPPKPGCAAARCCTCWRRCSPAWSR